VSSILGCGIQKRTSVTSLSSLLSFLHWHRVFSFTLPFFSRSFSRSFFRLWTLSLHTYTTVFDNTLRHANRIAVLQCTSPWSITTIIIAKCVCTYAAACKRRGKRVDLLSVLPYAYIYVHIKQSHHIIDWSIDCKRKNQ